MPIKCMKIKKRKVYYKSFTIKMQWPIVENEPKITKT